MDLVKQNNDQKWAIEVGSASDTNLADARRILNQMQRIVEREQYIRQIPTWEKENAEVLAQNEVVLQNIEAAKTRLLNLFAFDEEGDGYAHFIKYLPEYYDDYETPFDWETKDDGTLIDWRNGENLYEVNWDALITAIMAAPKKIMQHRWNETHLSNRQVNIAPNGGVWVGQLFDTPDDRVLECPKCYNHAVVEYHHDAGGKDEWFGPSYPETSYRVCLCCGETSRSNVTQMRHEEEARYYAENPPPQDASAEEHENWELNVHRREKYGAHVHNIECCCEDCNIGEMFQYY